MMMGESFISRITIKQVYICEHFYSQLHYKYVLLCKQLHKSNLYFLVCR